MHIYHIGQKSTRVEPISLESLKNGHSVTVATPEPSHISMQGARILRIPSFDPRMPGGFLYCLFASIAAIFIKPNTIHVHSYMSATIIRILMPFLPNASTVWTISSLPRFTFGISFIASGFDQVCASSRTVQYRLLTVYNIKTTYIPDGYTASALPDINPKNVGLAKEKYAVLFAEDTKEIRRISQAFTAVKSRKKLVVFGKGRTTANITYIDAPLTSRLAISIVRQAGLIITANPAHSPLLLQAMDAGKQIIATTDSLHEEILGITGKYYKHSDYIQLTALIQDAFRSPFMNSAAMLRVKRHFAWSKIAQEYERAYKHSKAVLVPFDSIIAKNSFKLAI